jgi:gamma-glutamyl-gamma-aminobutyrate hydrolase PuuD
MNKVFIVGCGTGYEAMFVKQGWQVVDDIHDADLIQFIGGEDVTPSYYGEQTHPATHSNKHRDATEALVYDYCRKYGKPMVGICRGGQFLHVMNGGSMWQDVKGHAIYGTHDATDLDTGIVLPVTSTHHQMMRESEHGVTLLVGTHHSCGYKEHMNMDTPARVECNVDVEAVYYPETDCLCFQPHPEFIDGTEQCRAYYFNRIAELLV